MKDTLTEKDIRKLRDNIYGKGSDKNWETCKHNWMTPDGIKWLIKNQSK